MDQIKTVKELAFKLAQTAHQIEQIIPVAYEKEQENGYLHRLLKTFQRELLPSLKLSADNEKDYSFADIYAQTIAYTLFTARVFGYVRDKKAGRTQETLFDRESAWQQLPETNPFLRKLFQDVSESSAEKLGDDLMGAIADIFIILRITKMDAILSDFEMKMNREDIVIRFYEDFLAAYKPQMRKQQGVYYTPEPVVSYMVRSVDILVQEKFNKPLGLADPTVTILDPACGTGTFLLYIFQLIYQRFQESPATLTEGLTDRSWSGYVEERLLPRVFGFELLMSPYAIAHLKIGLFLQETGYKFDSTKRLGVYLINTLEDITLREETQQLSLNISQTENLINEEAKAKVITKKEESIMVIIGNPPYSGHSDNNNSWIKELVNDYYFVDGKPLGEKNPKHLQNDYVKFIRFAQWQIDKSGQGILAFISNHGFLDNFTFRGMRQHLINSFNGIYVYNLHGNVRKRKIMNEIEDKNVFGIRQGVSIALALKVKDKCSYNYAELYGSKDYKYKTLSENTIKTTKFSELKPKFKFYLLKPHDTSFFTEYKNYFKINDVMPVSCNGFITHRNNFAIDFEKEKLYKRIAEMRNESISDEEYYTKYAIKDNRDWKLKEARQLIKNDTAWEDKLINYLHRPFDWRECYFSSVAMGRLRRKLVDHVANKDNLCLLLSKEQLTKNYKHCWVSQTITESCFLNSTTHCFPFYLYPNKNNLKELQQEKQVNFSKDFLEKIEINLGYLPTPETIFYYIYAILHSPTYRTRYAEFLKIDFPRVPITSNKNLFFQLAEYGEELVALHLMKSLRLNNLITQFTENGGHGIVDPVHPKYTQGTVVINKKDDKFIGVPETVWNFHVGGHQVCQKWLKDRKGRTLTDNDIQHYQRIIVALQETIILMQSIDAAILSWPI